MRNDQIKQAAVAVIAVVAAVALVLALVSCTPRDSSGVPAAQGGSSYADLVEKVSPSVVTVRTDSGVGSGVVYRSDVVLTNEHVVGEAEQVDIEYADGSRSGATVLATDSVTDLAVVRTDRNDLPVAEFRPELPRPGDPVLAIGSPLGFENSVTSGIVSGLHREIPGSAERTRSLVDLVQTDAPISPGNSGGALLDTGGRVIGINEAYIPPAIGAVSLGFAIPAATAVDVAEQLPADGTAEHPYLGVTVGRLTDEIRERFGVRAEYGVLVLAVDEQGPARTADIRAGDVIKRLGGAEVRTVEALLGALRTNDTGEQVTATIVRDGDELDVPVKIGSRSR